MSKTSKYFQSVEGRGKETVFHANKNYCFNFVLKSEIFYR